MSLKSRIVFNINEDFWVQFPELTPVFKEIKKEFKKESSSVMWALLMDFHPKSMYKNIEEVGRRNMIDVDYLGFHLEWSNYAKEQELLEKFFLTKAEKYLIGWEQKMDERQHFIASIPYSSDTYELLDKMMSATDKMWKQYLACLKDVEDEETTAIGNSQESPAELGLI